MTKAIITTPKITQINSASFVYLLTLTFILFGLVGILNHEMWRDELQAWMIVRDSDSIVDLFKNTRYEGHPRFWHLGLYALSRLTSNPIAMQLYHLLLASIGIFIFALYSPFTRLQKVLFSFGYFPFFEYGIISRNYVLGLIFIFTFCALYPKRHQNYLPLAITLFLLANTNIYSSIIAIALGLTLLIDRFFLNKSHQYRYPSHLNLIISALIAAIGLIIAALQMLPPPDSGFFGQEGVKIQLVDIMRLIWASYIPVPDIFRYNFWETNIASSLQIAGFKLGSLLSRLGMFGFGLFAIAFFLRKPVVLATYLLGTVSILLFSYLKLLGSIRHHGHLYILLIACLWLASYYQNSDAILNLFKGKLNIVYRIARNTNSWLNQTKNQWLTVLLCCHLFAASIAFTRDFYQPFSQGKAIANYIEQHHLADNLIVGSSDSAASTVAGYLNHKQIYYPESNRFGTFIIWDNKRKVLKLPQSLKRISEFMQSKNEQALLILNYDVRKQSQEDYIDSTLRELNPRFTVSKLHKFGQGVVFDENYNLYLMQPKSNL